MKHLKKVILSLFLPLLMIGCGVSKNKLSTWFEPGGKIKVLSTTAQVGGLVSAIGGDRVDSIVLITGDLDPHSYEIVKGDLEKFERADLIFFNGLGLEHGASMVSLLNGSPKAMAVGDSIQRAHPEQILRNNTVPDPHVWMDISLWQKGIGPIVEALSAKDPEGRSYYEAQGKVLAGKMEASHNELLAILQNIPDERRYLVTSHDAFHYFTRSYLAKPGEENWNDRFRAPEGLAPEGQLNPRDIQKIIDFLRIKNISVLFPESNVNKDSIRKIASAGKELGLEISICREPLYGDAMSGLDYLEMMEKNARTIAKYL